LFARAVAAVVVVSGITVLSPAHAVSADTVIPRKILIAGDSITVGIPGDYTWRYRLYREFQRQRIPVDFVGPLKYPVGNQNKYLVRSGWDMDHYAITGTPLYAHVEQVREMVGTYDPDVLIAAYGTNDLVQGRTVDQIMQDWDTYVRNARAAKPGIKIILLELNSTTLPEREALNQRLNQFAEKDKTLAGPGRVPIVVADVDFAGWNAAKHTYDGKHPSPTGEMAIAQRVGYALKSLGEMATPYIPWTTNQPWPPPLRATMAVKSKTRQVAFQWATTKANVGAKLIRVKLVPLTGTGRERTSAFTRKPDLTTTKMAPGAYQVQLQARRGYMSSPWTAIGRVRIKASPVRRHR
jgi:lysophospholipase L1-like esterase